MDEYNSQIKQKITGNITQPTKIKSSYGTWQVLADVIFYIYNGKSTWTYPQKHFYFWNKKDALGFILKNQ